MKNSICINLNVFALAVVLSFFNSCRTPHTERITSFQITSQLKALKLKEEGYAAAEVANELKENSNLKEFEIGNILKNVEFKEEEYIDFTAFEIVKKFAPILKFDRAHNGLPMSAEVYFKNVMYPKIKEGTITWDAGSDKPSENANLGIRCLWGRDDCTIGMSNTDFRSLSKGMVPTYFRVISDRQGSNEGRLRIVYWWFYGFQEPCNRSKVFHLWMEDGAHHGDWEKIMVTTSPDKSHIQAVTYYFHGDHYTRKKGGFETIGKRPVAYVGRLAHGNYHNRKHSGWLAGTGFECCEFADYRDPVPNSVWINTNENLVSLSGNSESWMIAENTGLRYEYKGREYEKKGDWTWGPHISWCSQWFWNPFGDNCLKWNIVKGCRTHPTKDPLHWEIDSCSDAGCGNAKFPCPEPKFDQGWLSGKSK